MAEALEIGRNGDQKGCLDRARSVLFRVGIVGPRLERTGHKLPKEGAQNYLSAVEKLITQRLNSLGVMADRGCIRARQFKDNFLEEKDSLEAITGNPLQILDDSFMMEQVTEFDEAYGVTSPNRILLRDLLERRKQAMASSTPPPALPEGGQTLSHP